MLKKQWHLQCSRLTSSRVWQGFILTTLLKRAQLDGIQGCFYKATARHSGHCQKIKPILGNLLKGQHKKLSRALFLSPSIPRLFCSIPFSLFAPFLVFPFCTLVYSCLSFVSSCFFRQSGIHYSMVRFLCCIINVLLRGRVEQIPVDGELDQINRFQLSSSIEATKHFFPAPTTLSIPKTRGGEETGRGIGGRT